MSGTFICFIQCFIVGAEEFLLVARKTKLLIVSLDTPDYTHTVLPVPNLKHVFAIDYDLVEGHVYWTESGSPGSISRSNLNGTGKRFTVNKQVEMFSPLGFSKFPILHGYLLWILIFLYLRLYILQYRKDHFYLGFIVLWCSLIT